MQKHENHLIDQACYRIQVITWHDLWLQSMSLYWWKLVHQFLNKQIYKWEIETRNQEIQTALSYFSKLFKRQDLFLSSRNSIFRGNMPFPPPPICYLEWASTLGTAFDLLYETLPSHSLFSKWANYRYISICKNIRSTGIMYFYSTFFGWEAILWTDSLLISRSVRSVRSKFITIIPAHKPQRSFSSENWPSLDSWNIIGMCRDQ